MRRLLASTDAWLARVAVLFFAGFLGCVVLQVVFRYVLQAPLPWSEEVAVYLFVWSSLLTAAIVVGQNDHFSIAFLADRVGPGSRRVLDLVGVLLSIVFVLIIVWNGTWWSWRMASGLSPVLQLPQGAVYAIIPLAGAYMLFHLCVQLRQLLRPPGEAGVRR